MSNLSPLYDAFRDRVQAEVIDEAGGEGQVRFNLRVPRGVQTVQWQAVIKRILQLEQLELARPEGARWTTDISKQYLLRGDLRYGWRIIFESRDLEGLAGFLAQEVRALRIQGGQVDEVRLVGSPNRSRGAGPMGTVAVGAQALFLPR